MDKNKTLFITLVVIFCVILAGGACFSLGTKMNKSSCEIEKEDKISEKEEDIKEFSIPEKDSDLNTVLYNYINSNNKNLEEYLKNMSNGHKVFLGGVGTLTEIKQNLIKLFGSDLNVVGEDFNTSSGLHYKYDSNTESFSLVNEFGTDVNELGSVAVYNYKLDSLKQTKENVVLTYYGLYLDSSALGNDLLTNNKNINRYSHDFEEDGISDEIYFENIFHKNKNNFFKFVYTYKLVDGKYVLVDFKQL